MTMIFKVKLDHPWPDCPRCGRRQELIFCGPFVCPDRDCQAEQDVAAIFNRVHAARGEEDPCRRKEA